MQKKHIAIVIPCYNEEENISEVYKQIRDVFRKHLSGYAWSVTYVEDGSTDGTVNEVRKLTHANDNVQIVSLSRNYGHQVSLLAAIHEVPSNSTMVITMDADLQHPPEFIPELVEQWEMGNKIVFTEKIDTKGVSIMKKITTYMYYKLFQKMTGVKLPTGAADFRLYDHQVVKELLRYDEHGIFLRGIVASMGYKRVILPYQAQERFAGTRKFSYQRMIKLAVDGIFSYSTLPLRFAIDVGVFFATAAILYALFATYSWASSGNTPPGWASITAGVFLMGGVILVFIGVIGAYVGRIFIQTKGRPMYHLDSIIKSKEL